jgi:hypothetical protein
MRLFSCCRFKEESDVELKYCTPTPTPEHSIRGKHKLVDKYMTTIEFDKNDRKIETRTFNRDLFTPLDNNMISETFIYTLNNPDQVILRIRLYDNGSFMINRYDFTISHYVVVDMDNPMNCYISRFIDDLAQLKSDGEVQYVMHNEKWLKELHNIVECPDYGFKIIVSEKNKKHTYEIGRYVS